jgi:hypothetical protein
MNTPIPPKCLSIAINDVTGSMIRLDQPSFDWLSIALGWLTSLFGGVSKGVLPARLQTVEQQATVLALFGGQPGKGSEAGHGWTMKVLVTHSLPTSNTSQSVHPPDSERACSGNCLLNLLKSS